MNKVLILGCGPAGLIAAHSAALLDCSIRILSRPRKSFMNGAQYLHEPVEGVPGIPSFRIDYQLVGDPIAYRNKVYGRNWDGNVSPEDLEGTHDAWDIRATYDFLWDTYEDAITDWDATSGGLSHLIDKSKPDLVVSTIPAPLLCINGHSFMSQRIWSTDKVLSDVPENTVICNGEDHPAWYRASSIQGWKNTEWPDHVKPPLSPMWGVTKPTSNTCDCWPGIIHGGRYGKWQKGVLSHEVFKEVRDALQA